MLKAIVMFVLGVIVGCVVMGLVVAGIEWAGQLVYPPPPGLDVRNPEHLQRLLAAQPIGALVFVVVAWVGGAFVGGGAAAAIARRWPRAAAVCVGLVVVAAVAAATQAMPGQPLWMTIAGLVLPVPAALFAAWPMRKRPANAG